MPSAIPIGCNGEKAEIRQLVIFAAPSSESIGLT